jgi:DNA-binding transcriptional ArsR family regulator
MLTRKKSNKIKNELSDKIAKIPFFFDALADRGRFMIIKLLIKRKDLCVSDIADILKITPSAACQQLRILERISFVKRIRMGQKVCYRLNNKDLIVRNIINLIKKVEK